jgi:hypothetical protein
MECKKCQANISIVEAAESASTLKRFSEAAGMPPEAVTSFVSLKAPRCRKCMEEWESGEDDTKRAAPHP